MISSRAPFKASEVLPPRPNLKSLMSLTPLQGHVSVIYAGSFFHLFDEAEQLRIALKLRSLLSPLPGSIIFGAHIGALVEGTSTYPKCGPKGFCHSPGSWKDLWEGQVFEKGEIRVDTQAVEAIYKKHEKVEAEEAYWLYWSITRL